MVSRVFTKLFKTGLLVILLGAMVACASPIIISQGNPTTIDTQPEAVLPTDASGVSTDTPEATLLPSETVTITVASSPTSQVDSSETPTGVANTPVPTITPRPSPGPDTWRVLPVIPEISARTIQIYKQGLELGNDPSHFSKVGDCQNVSSYFLSPFEYPSAYNLGQYTNLQDTIQWYKGSFSRESLAVKGGFNVAAVLSPLRADPQKCDQGESPVQCELRIWNPSVAIVSMETWWSGNPENYEKYMRQLLDYLISEGVVPILATKADNLEGNNQINKALAKLAWDYDIPLWNFWASVQDIPNHGLTEDGFHLTLGNYFYNDPVKTRTGWSMRNLTALQALDAFRRAMKAQP